MDEMMVSLTFSEPITSNPIQEDTSSPEKRSLVTKNKRIAGRHSRPSRYVNGDSTYISKVCIHVSHMRIGANIGIYGKVPSVFSTYFSFKYLK